MIKLENGSSVERETSVLYRGRPIIITLRPGGLEIRFKGKREKHWLDYEVALAAALKVEAREKGIKI